MKKQTHHLHIVRVLLLGLLVAAVGIVQVSPHSIPKLSYTSDPSVLAYATSMSRSDLLYAANQSRANNGLPPLTLNSALNSSAQMKAQHMVDNNYWAHVAPDGTQPWYFFGLAGYNYSAAGENLAYGFATSADTNTGWMNSPTHRANILGNYKDVGFGYVNGASFQGSQNTVVVAHYGTLASPPPPPPEPTPAPEPAPAPTSTPSVESSTVDEPTPQTPETSSPPEEETAESENTPEKDQNVDEKKEEETPDMVVAQTTDQTPPPVAIGSTASVSVWQSLLQGSLPTMAIISLGVVLTSAIGYGLTHRSLVRHAVASGQNFALHHPTFDVLALTAATMLILMTTVAQLQ